MFFLSSLHLVENAQLCLGFDRRGTQLFLDMEADSYAMVDETLTIVSRTQLHGLWSYTPAFTIQTCKLRKILRSYPEMISYSLKKYATDQTITKYDAAVLRYIQLAYMTSQQHAHDLVAKSYKVADVHDEETPNEVFIKRVDASIGNSLRHYWAQNPQADLTDIMFQSKSLPFIQKDAG